MILVIVPGALRATALDAGEIVNVTAALPLPEPMAVLRRKEHHTNSLTPCISMATHQAWL